MAAAQPPSYRRSRLGVQHPRDCTDPKAIITSNTVLGVRNDDSLMWATDALAGYRRDNLFHHAYLNQILSGLSRCVVRSTAVADKAVPAPDANETPETVAAYELNLAADEEEDREWRLELERMVAAAQQRQGDTSGPPNSTQTNVAVQAGAQGNPREGLWKKARRKMVRKLTWRDRQGGGR